MTKKIVYLSILTVLLLKPNYGKAQCAPAGTQEFTGQMNQNGTYKISSNQYASQIPSQIPSGVTLYIVGDASIEIKDISLAQKVQVCDQGTASISISEIKSLPVFGPTGINYEHLTVGPFGAVSFKNWGPSSRIPTPFLGEMKENSVISLCLGNTSQVFEGGGNMSRYTGSTDGKSFFIIGSIDYYFNLSSASISDKSNVTLIDFASYNKSTGLGQPLPSFSGDSFTTIDNTIGDSRNPFGTDPSIACNLKRMVKSIPGYTPTSTANPVQPGRIQVNVSEDTDGNFIGDSPLSNVELLFYQSTNLLGRGYTDANGNFTFPNLAPGTYSIVEADPKDYFSVADSDGGDNLNSVQVTVTAGNAANAQFVDRSDNLVCNPTGATGQGESFPSAVGISTLDRGNDTSWLNSVKNAQLVLESKTKGLVLPHIASPNNIAAPSEGMIIYDTTQNCIKIYRNNKWGCIVQKNCININ